MEAIGMVADTASSSGKGVRYGAFGGGGVTALVVEVLLGVGRLDVDRGAEMAIFDADIDVFISICLSDAHPQAGRRSCQS